MSSSSSSSSESRSRSGRSRRRKKYHEEIREEIRTIKEALVKADLYEVSKFELKKHVEHIVRNDRKKILEKLEGIWQLKEYSEGWPERLEFPTHELDPLNTEDSDKLYLACIEFIYDYAKSFAQKDESLRVVEPAKEQVVTLKKVRKDRHLRNPRYQLTVPPAIATLLSNPKTTRICYVLYIVDTNDMLQMDGFIVFYLELEKSTVIVELFSLDPERLEKHPAVQNIDEQLTKLLHEYLQEKVEVKVGIFWSNQTRDEFVKYLPLCEEIRPFTFSLIWNMYLFLDRLREPQYTLSDLEQVVTDFESLDVDIRKRAYLECFFLLSRFRFFVEYVQRPVQQP